MVELKFVTWEEQQQYATLLENNTYGNIDAALRFFDKYSEILIVNLGLHQCHSDPCIFLKHDNNEQLSVIITTQWMTP